MKKLTIILLALFSFSAYAQTVSDKGIIPESFNYGVLVECDGVSDFLVPDGEIRFHMVEHFDKKMDNPLGIKWSKNQVHGILISEATGEVFKVHDINKGDLVKGTWVTHVRAIGDQGTVYIITWHLTWTNPLEWPTVVNITFKCV